ncbi:MAG: right-handed parallel beta-helix repeat-containing protein [Anaerolineae bacterium]|nr:right-handed parallel beta-helix repeat-containing protein [Anaerolineae bacterium]
MVKACWAGRLGFAGWGMVVPLMLLVLWGALLAGAETLCALAPPDIAMLVPAWDNYPVKFVGRDHVDLKWQLYQERPTYRVYRDGLQIAEYGRDATFHRDTGVFDGQMPTYKVCAIQAGFSDKCSAEQQVTVGQIKGALYKDLTWSDGQYLIWQTVTITDDATLEIRPGVEVVQADNGYGAYLDDQWRGAIQADGAHLDINLYVRGGDSRIVNSTLYPGRSLHFVSWHGRTISGNTFQTSTVYIESEGPWVTQHVVTDNSFVNGELRVGQSPSRKKADVLVYGNRFDAGSEVQLSGESEGSIEDNQFSGSGVSLSTSGSVTVRYNRFRGAPPGGTAVWVQASSPATVEGNVLDGRGASLGDMKNGILVRGLWPEWGLPLQPVLIRDNILTGWSKGILLLGDLEAEIRDNTFTANAAGIWADSTDSSYVLDPAAAIHGNCIAGNGCTGNAWCGGLTTEGRAGDPLDASGNYWGDASGPTHPDNPTGQGDKVVEIGGGGLVDYSGWLGAHDCALTNLSVAGVEVVQVVQDLGNSVPLVVGKRTVARVYLDSTRETVSTPVELRARRDGALLGSLQGTGTAAPLLDWDAARSAPGLLFLLPDAWLSGALSLTVEVNPQQAIQELTYEDNRWARDLIFAGRAPVTINYLPINYGPYGFPARLPAGETILLQHSLLAERLPYPETSYRILPPLSVADDVDQDLEAITRFVQSLYLIRMAAFPREPLVAAFPDGSIGAPPWTRGMEGLGFDDESNLSFAAGRSLGLFIPNTEAPCGDPFSPKGWPYADATIQEYGYQHVTDQIVLPEHFDLASPCTPRWISPFHYCKLLLAGWGYSLDFSPRTPSPASTTYLLAAGLVYTDGTALFAPFWQVTGDGAPDGYPPPGYQYCVETRDAGDAALHSYCFDADFVDPSTGEDTGVAFFAAGLPLDPAARKVVLHQDGTDLGQVLASDHAPVVTLTAPNGGETLGDSTVVEWTAHNDDPGDELTFQLWYSADDGGAWLPLTAEISGTTAYDLDLSWLPGSSASRLRVEVSDGFHAARDDSDGAFSVPNKAPWVAIRLPEAGAVVTPPLTLQGSAYDLEEGVLGGPDLAWISDQDGLLGTGDTLWDVALAPGSHTLTLTAIDGQGLQGQAVVTVTVGGGAEHPVYLPLVVRGF